MIKSLQVMLALLVLNVLLVAPVRAGGDQDKSPADVFKAFAAAVKKDDLTAMMSHITRDSQAAVAGTMWAGVSFIKSWSSKPTPKQQKEIAALDEILKRRGLSDDAMMKIIEKQATTEEQRTRMLVALGELVKDNTAFVTEILRVYTGPEGSKEIDVGWVMYLAGFTVGSKEIAMAKVKEVKIDGQQAKSQATVEGADGKESTATIYFKLESAVWKIDFIETCRHWPQPPVPAQVQRPAPQVQPPATYYQSRPGFLRCLFPRLRHR